MKNFSFDFQLVDVKILFKFAIKNINITWKIKFLFQIEQVLNCHTLLACFQVWTNVGGMSNKHAFSII